MMKDGAPEKSTPPGRFAATLPVEGREGALLARNSGAQARAKQLRKALTGPEAKLWVHLKRIRMIDTHFRRQVPIGPYVVDFACLRGRLVIEVDGDQHGWHNGKARDELRTRYLRSRGFEVIRVWNHEVLSEIESVLDTVYAKLHGSVDATPVSASKTGLQGGRARASSPSTGEVPSESEAEGVISPRTGAL